MIRLILASAIVLATQVTVAAEKDYVKGDGTLDVTCADTNENSRPFHNFNFELYYDQNSEAKEPLEMGFFAYKINAVQQAFRGSEEFVVPQPLVGCEFAEIKITPSNEGQLMDVYFECAADGDAGYGSIVFDIAKGEIKGKIQFPEGKPDLMHPLTEDTSFDLLCDFNFN